MNQATARTGTMAAGGVGAMLAGAIVGVAKLFHVDIPADLAGDIAGLVVIGAAFIIHRTEAQKAG